MRRSSTLLLLIVLVLLITTVSVSPALADTGQQQVTAQNLALFTNYPAQEVAIGESVTFGLVLRTLSDPQIARLVIQDLPDGWSADFRGGGRVVESAYVEPENDTKVDLRVNPPADVTPGTYKFSVLAKGDSSTAQLPIELVIKEKLPPSLKFQVDLPTLKGAPNSTFHYNATLKNEGDEDLSVNLTAETVSGLQADFKLSGQDVTNIPVAANESKRLSIDVKVFPDMSAGQYPIKVTAQGGSVQADASLVAEVTGQPDLSVTAPDGRLSGEAYIGQTTPLKLVVQNNGSAPAQNIELNANQPSGWKVDFNPKQIPEVPAGQQIEVTANVQPSDQAIAGDYVVTVRAQPQDGPSKSADFRITVLTSTLWGMVGIGLIAVAVVVVGLAVMRFGRR